METTNKVPLMLLDVKVFSESNNCVFVLCQQTNKVQCMHIAFTNVKITRKKDKKLSES